MLLARFAVSEIAVVRQIDKNVRAPIGELPHQIRKSRLITNENAQLLAVAGGENLDAWPGTKSPASWVMRFTNENNSGTYSPNGTRSILS